MFFSVFSENFGRRISAIFPLSIMHEYSAAEFMSFTLNLKNKVAKFP